MRVSTRRSARSTATLPGRGSDEIAGAYEVNTGRVIVERYHVDGLDPAELPACLVAGHGPLVWGSSAGSALENAVALEHVAAIATHQASLGEIELDRVLRERHFSRKHGPEAYYGQAGDPTAGR